MAFKYSYEVNMNLHQKLFSIATDKFTRASIEILLSVCFFGSSMIGQVPGAGEVGQVWKTDTAKHAVPLTEFRALLKRDGIPPIDHPSFIRGAEAAEAYFMHEPVISLEVEGSSKAYPLNILTYHEIVNDTVGGIPVTVTYCPLCNAAIAFDRRLQYGGKEYVLDFGVSGMLRKSDMVMWDRQTETWWQQFTGEAVVGDLVGAALTPLPALIISLEDYLETWPAGLVLSKKTGFSEQEPMYGKNVYENYDDIKNKKPRLFFEDVDDRLPAMERVVDVRVGDDFRIYPLTVLQDKKVINDRFKSADIVLFHRYGTNSILGAGDIKKAQDIGSVTVFDASPAGERLVFEPAEDGFRDTKTGSTWNIAGKCISGPMQGKELKPRPHGNHFAFAWFAFHPDTEIYGK